MDKKRDAQRYCQEGQARKDLKEFQRAVVYLTRAIKLDGSNSDYLIGMANTVGSQDKYKEASVLSKIVVSMDPKNALVYYNYGCYLQMLGNDDESIEMYKKALNFDPNYADVYYNLASVLIMQGKYEEAQQHYSKVLKLQPSDAYLVANCLGYSYFLQGEFAKAIPELQKSINLNKNDPLRIVI